MFTSSTSFQWAIPRYCIVEWRGWEEWYFFIIFLLFLVIISTVQCIVTWFCVCFPFWWKFWHWPQLDVSKLKNTTFFVHALINFNPYTRCTRLQYSMTLENTWSVVKLVMSTLTLTCTCSEPIDEVTYKSMYCLSNTYLNRSSARFYSLPCMCVIYVCNVCVCSSIIIVWFCC